MALTLNNPSSFSHVISGPSSQAIALTTSHNDTLPITSGTPKLPTVIRSLFCVSSGSVTVQTANGVTFTVTLTTGQTLNNQCYIVAVSGVTNGQFIGFV